jgi:hypothetical protein
MLVLSRKSNQALIIDHDVVVTVVEIGDDFVRLSIESPNERDVARRYPQALDVPEGSDGRPVVVTLSLRHAAVLDRFRRRMADDESTPPSRDAALGALLDAVSDDEESILSRLGGREAAS